MELSFKGEKDLNYSANQTGVLIRYSDLYDMVNSDDMDLGSV